ncbi:ribosome maturation factor rimm [Phtheirospermum japonicum]|uniref:Ribosome maturation factor rimm n=1 Tax=Phtheirospermum japonicum TaxID=374723 RepID=A0A830BWW2_9LAMI|nr:ribosome maturation factor rimm [Phtheirospermum japonicum]
MSTQELVESLETTSSASGFIETGYIYGVHGLQGEVRVKPSTDFPDLRFSKPGTRWLKQQVSGNETISEIGLVGGRGHPGQSWIVRFNDINTVEQAQKLVGSAILESREPVGTVVNVFNSGASDLLHVKLSSLRNTPNQNGKSKTGESDDSGPLVWVPFVEAIVPVVDVEKREMLITPPKGLLELNIRSDDRSKKERRELEWKERKKLQRQLIAAKKKLCEMGQQHVFDGFRHGEKDQKSLLANQIVTVNSKLLQQALQTIETPSTRLNLLDVLSAVPRSNTLRVSDNPSSVELYCKLQKEGSVLTSNGKAAIVLVLEDIENISDTNFVDSGGNEKTCLLVKALVDDDKRFVKIEDRTTVPLVLVSPAGSVSSLKELFQDHDYFAFDPEKVWFLEEEKLPVVSSTAGGHKILMRSPWEIFQRPIGSGGLISLFSAHESLLDQLSEMGVEYIEVCKVNKKGGNGPSLLGLVDTVKANVGIRLVKYMASEEELDVILSMSFLRKLTKQINKLRFEPVLDCNSYVEKVDNDWIDVIPSASNSYEFRSSIYCCLDASPISKVCVLDSCT